MADGLRHTGLTITRLWLAGSRAIWGDRGMTWLLWVAGLSVGLACAAVIGSRFFKSVHRPRPRRAVVMRHA